MEISQERLEKFWKRWGFKELAVELDTSLPVAWVGPEKSAWNKLPALTLDNLMK